MDKKLNAVIFAVVLVTLLVGVVWANLRTYHIKTRVNFDTVIWNDRQLVLFLNTYDSGASMRVFEAYPAPRSVWCGVGAGSRRLSGARISRSSATRTAHSHGYHSTSGVANSLHGSLKAGRT